MSIVRCATLSTLSAIEAEVVASSSIVVEVSVAAVVCWFVVAASSCAALDSSADEDAISLPAERIWPARMLKLSIMRLNERPSACSSSGPSSLARTRRSPSATRAAASPKTAIGLVVRRANDNANPTTSSEPSRPMRSARLRCSSIAANASSVSWRTSTLQPGVRTGA